MGRPPLPVGAHGRIKFTKIYQCAACQAGECAKHRRPQTAVEARCRFRRSDGTITRLLRVRPTQSAAETALKAAVVELANEARGGDITPASRFNKVAELWFADIELLVAEGRKQPKTRDIYRTYLDLHVLPALGELQMREVDTVRCEKLMTAKRRGGAKDDKLAGIRNVLSAVCSYGVRHGAMDANPVRELAQLQRRARPKPRALTAAERTDMLAKLDDDQEAARLDLGDILRGMLATGVRVSEMLGCCGDDVLLGDPARPRLRVAHRTIRVKGQRGARRRERSPDSKGDEQLLRIPQWSVPMFRARKLTSGGSGPLFPTTFGDWRTNDTVTKPLRAALDRAGYDWLTSHGMRDTVANVLKAAGIPVRQIADQLGQASSAVTERHYLERDASNDDQVEALEGMM